MGTNFYINNGTDHTPRSGQHIGKRSAAGQYCWDCHMTLCKGGPGNVHYGTVLEREREEVEPDTWCPRCHRDIVTGWFDACPICGKKPTKDETDKGGAVGIELGFSQPQAGGKTGVSSCSSFSWAMLPRELRDLYADPQQNPYDGMIVDEYGRTMPYPEFVSVVLANCPIQYFSGIGQEFS